MTFMKYKVKNGNDRNDTELVLYCFVPKKMNLQRMTSCDFHSYYNMLYNTAYFVLNN